MFRILHKILCLYYLLVINTSLHVTCSLFALSLTLGRRRLRPVHSARPRGATPHPRSGAEARRTPCLKGCHQEELPHVRGQGQQPRVPGCDCAGTAERSHPTSEARSGSREEQTHVQGAVAAWVQEGLEELSHVEGQEGQW